MTVAAGAIFALITACLAWRGYRRGAKAVLRGWLARFSGLALMCLAGWLIWRSGGSLVTTCLAGVAAGALGFVSAVFILKIHRSRQVNEETHEAQPALLDHVAGGALGVIYAEACCLGLACLAGVFVFGMSASRPVIDGPAVERADCAPEWVKGLGKVCRTVADISDYGMLSRLPLLKEYGSEIVPLVTILTAPREKLALIAEKRNLMRFADTPAVKAALDDVEYCSLLSRARQGELSVMRPLLDSPITRELISCPELREFAATVTPSDLVKDMAEAESPLAPVAVVAPEDLRLSTEGPYLGMRAHCHRER